MDGISVATGYDKDFGGIKERAATDISPVADNSFVAGESHRVNIDFTVRSLQLRKVKNVKCITAIYS